MRILIAVVGLALGLYGLTIRPAAAADAEVRYLITNGGDDVGGRAGVEYYPAGKHDGPTVSSAPSGASVRMPDGTYNVHLVFHDGTAQKELWFDNQHFTGKVDKTVELGVAITEVRYLITNGGDDVGGRAGVEYYPAGKHDGPTVSSAPSGASVRMPDGTYNVHLVFHDGTAQKELWFDNQHFTGKVDKTVELAVAITEVRYLITNGGDDVGGRAGVEYYPAGKHDGPTVSSAPSGASVRMPDGTYNVHLVFHDGTAQKELWFDNQHFTGKVDKTVELAVAITEVRYLITNGGDDVGGRAGVEYYPAGKHDGPTVSSAPSGASVRMPEGIYNVHLIFHDGTAQKELWFDNQHFTGKVDKTVELAVAITEVRYLITNGGDDVGGRAGVEYYPAGKHDGPTVSSAPSGASVRMPEGTYNVHLVFNDGTAHKELWFDNQHFTGKVDKTVELAVAITEVRYLITNGGDDVGGRAGVEYYPAGKHDGPTVSSAPSGASVRMPEGTYNVHLVFNDGTAHKEAWFDNQAFSGKVEKTVELAALITEVRYVITNGGDDVGGKGGVAYYPPGKHDGPQLASAPSGGSVRMPDGTYDVRVVFEDGFVHKELWINGQNFSDKVDRTVELGLTLAKPTVMVTLSGADVGDKASVSYFKPGSQREIGTVSSAQKAVLEAGTYDIRGRLEGAEGWLRAAQVTGEPVLHLDLTPVKVQPTKVALTITAVRGGAPVPGAWCGIYAPGRTDGPPLARFNSGSGLEGPPGTYDLGCTVAEGGTNIQGWLKGQALRPGKIALTVELPAQCVAPTSIALGAPAATPEKIVPETGDFPYLAPVPGSRAAGGKASTSPVYVQLADAHQPELVANGSIIKWYQAPKCISAGALVGLYHAALPGAGWTIVSEFHRADAGLTAHYGRGGRNIWANIHADNNGYVLAVADATIAASQLAADLSSKCHLALTGVLFDFDKSTLKPESDAVLEQVSAIIVKVPTLRIEVQGNTDNVGGEAYNQTLSEARARSVVVWLTQHGVAANQLTARGYGKTRPVASNDTEEGRARNRRVEIANPACTAKGG